MNSSFEPVGIHNLGSVQLDGEAVEFWWAAGTGFISAQFSDRCPRGIANLDRIQEDDPVVVPLSHGAWLAQGDREQSLIKAGQGFYLEWTIGHRNMQSTADGGRRARDLDANEPLDPLLVNSPAQVVARQ